MGRKHGTLVQPAAQERSQPDDTPSAEPAALLSLCAICGAAVDVAEEYLSVQCNTCPEGGCTVHHECGVEFLLARASEKSNSHAAEKYRIKARKRPQEIFSLGQPCPNLAYTIGKQEGHGRTSVGSKDFKGAKAATGACSGFTTGAELIKPAKAAPAPLPQEALPAPRGPKKAKAAAAKAAALPAPAKRAGSAASSASGGVRLVGDKHAGWSTVGQPKGAGAAARIFGSKGPPAGGGGVPGAARPAPAGSASSVIPLGMPRPVELQMCQDFLDCDKCFIFNCPRAHGEAELRQREREWAAQQEARKREAARRQAQAAAAAQAQLEEELALQAQIASLETHSREALGLPSAAAHNAWGAPAPTHAPPTHAEPAMRLTDASLATMRTFKKQMCLNSILDLGFSVQQAQAATDAAAGDAERAAQLLLDGLPLSGAPPIDLSREVQVLGAAAAVLGLDATAVEAQLLKFGGNVDATLEALSSGVPHSGAASTAADDCPSTAEPDTPSARLPPWAADATSSAFSASSPANQSPRAAASAPAPFGSAVAEPGVLSLADFSSSPGPEAALEALAATTGAGWAAQPADDAQEAAGPAAAGFAFSLPAPVSGPSAYDDGYAAGLAAAAAMMQQQQGMGGQGQAFEQAAPPALAYVPPPQVRPEGDEAEVDALLSLLGIG